MNQVIRYQYQYIVWSIYMIAVYLSVIAQLWIMMINITYHDRWPVLLVWATLLFAGAVFTPKEDKP